MSPRCLKGHSSKKVQWYIDIQGWLQEYSIDLCRLIGCLESSLISPNLWRIYINSWTVRSFYRYTNENVQLSDYLNSCNIKLEVVWCHFRYKSTPDNVMTDGLVIPVLLVSYIVLFYSCWFLIVPVCLCVICFARCCIVFNG